MRNFPIIFKRTGIEALPGIAVFAGLMMFILLPGCKKDFQFDKVKDLSWNPDIALPLVNDSITFKKILTQGGASDHLYIDESGNISILYYYNNDAFKLKPSDLIKLAPASFSFQHQVTSAEQAELSTSDLPIPPVTFTFPLNGNATDQRVDKVRVKKGNIRVTTNNTFNNAGSMTISILNATKNGAQFSFTIEPFSSGPRQYNIKLDSVYFDLSSSSNTLKAEVQGLLRQSGSPVAGDEIRADFQISIDTISWFEGFLGLQTFDGLQDTIRVNVFNNAYTLGEVYFMDPQASITIINSVGVPAEVTIEKLVAINDVTGSTLDIANRLGSGTVFPIPSPLITATSPAITTMNYTNDNTGNAMNDFFNLKPDHVAFQIKTVINPTGTPLNFFSDASLLYDTLRVKLPLWGHFDHLTFVDTFDLAIDKPEELEYLEFHTKIRNGMPITGVMQIYFTDVDYHVIDSLAGNDPILIREAPVDPSTYLPYPGMYGEKDTTYILNTQRMQNLKGVKKMLLKAVLNSANQGQSDVKLRENQAIRLNFSARAKLRKAINPGK